MAARQRIKVTRMPSRASYERAVADSILDEAIVSHVGTVAPAGHPVVIPTLHARAGEWLYIHGSAASPTLRRAGQTEICLTATLIDGLVLARSAVHHSVNYRSVVVFGQAEQVAGAEGKRLALEAFTEKLVPGRWGDARLPTAQELKGTAVLRLPLAEASAKIRSGGPLDDEDDYALPVWAGTVGLQIAAGPPQPDDRLLDGVECPAYVTALSTRSDAAR
ncbi:MAG TPA: pyridoxamine 5'-phosphate oxidase family protein [Solirubrobacterales bacterium]|nr:pyridoxamine 5'-phosphate oxidase family protein [Solirubrobacterales bacterium]